jgi:excisionase family DNA binding protein
MSTSISWVGGYKEAAAYLNASERQVRRWVHERKLAHTKLGGNRVQFTRDQLDELIERTTVKAAV